MSDEAFMDRRLFAPAGGRTSGGKSKSPAKSKPRSAAKKPAARKPAAKKPAAGKPAAPKKAAAKNAGESRSQKAAAGKSLSRKSIPKNRTSSAAKQGERSSAKPRTGAQVKEKLGKIAENVHVTAKPPKPKSGTDGEPATKGLNAEKMTLYGQAMWLLGRSAPHRNLFLADMDWMIVPPIALGQCRLWRQQGIPIGLATWAFVTQDVADRVQSEMAAGRVPKLAPQEWKRGEQAVLMDLIAPFGGAEKFVEDIQKNVFGAMPIVTLGVGSGGEGVASR